jgi:hypothetical protein
MTVLSTSVIIVLRRGLGERVMPSLFVTTGIAFAAWFVYESLTPPLPPTPFFFSFVTTLAILSLIHRISLWFRRQPGAIHSFSTGRTRLALPWRPAITERYVEPLLVVGLGLILYGQDMLFGGWLVAAGVALFIEEQMARIRGRIRALESADSRLEANDLHTASEARLASEHLSTGKTKPVHVAQPTEHPPTTSDFKRELDPALRQLIDDDSATKGEDQP